MRCGAWNYTSIQVDELGELKQKCTLWLADKGDGPVEVEIDYPGGHFQVKMTQQQAFELSTAIAQGLYDIQVNKVSEATRLDSLAGAETERAVANG